MEISYVILNIAVIILELIGLYISISKRKWGILAYYTQISNLVTLASSAALVIAGSNVVTVNMRYLSSCMLAMTFIITLCVLVPMGAGFKRMMLSGNGLYHHTLCPVISVASYIALEQHSVLWMIPVAVTFIYGITMLILNAKDKYDGPYPFFRVKNQSRTATVIWVLVLVGIISGISLGMSAVAPAAEVPDGRIAGENLSDKDPSARYVVFEGVFIEAEDIEPIIEEIRGPEPVYENRPEYYHSTITFLPDEDSRELYGREVNVKITGYEAGEVETDEGGTTHNEGLAVELSSDDEEVQRYLEKNGTIRHITLSYEDLARYTSLLDFSHSEKLDYTVKGRIGAVLNGPLVTFDANDVDTPIEEGD